GHPANHFRRRRAHAALRPPAHAEHRVLSPDVMSAWHTPGLCWGLAGPPKVFGIITRFEGLLPFRTLPRRSLFLREARPRPLPAGLRHSLDRKGTRLNS